MILTLCVAEQDRQKRRAERYRAERDREEQSPNRKQERAASPLPQRLTRPTGITDIQENMGLDNNNELYESISVESTSLTFRLLTFVTGSTQGYIQASSRCGQQNVGSARFWGEKQDQRRGSFIPSLSLNLTY
jgi:hypothetical protein